MTAWEKHGFSRGVLGLYPGQQGQGRNNAGKEGGGFWLTHSLPLFPGWLDRREGYAGIR